MISTPKFFLGRPRATRLPLGFIRSHPRKWVLGVQSRL